jgi:hypothetical protein
MTTHVVLKVKGNDLRLKISSKIHNCAFFDAEQLSDGSKSAISQDSGDMARAMI